MRIVLTFALNAGLNLVLSLAVAGVLGPDSFGRFAIAALVVTILVTLGFDWLRLSATRYVSEASRAADPALRRSLDLGYLSGSGLLAAAAALALAGGLGFGLGPAAIALVLVAAIANARFEYDSALSRALFLEGAYLRLIVVRNVLSLGLMVGAAWLFGTAEAVLVGLAASSALATLAVRRALAETGPGRPPAEPTRLLGFARYGLPIVAANLVYQGLVLLNRAAETSLHGFASAGQLSLSTDVTIRLLLSAGAALDVFLFQRAVREAAIAGEEAGRRAVARNMVLVGATLLLLALGWAMALPAVEALIVPARYRGDFRAVGLVMIPGVLAFCLVQFALSPVFQLAGRTLAILRTAGAALAANVILLAGLDWLPADSGPVMVASIHSASLAVGFLAAIWLVRRESVPWPPVRDLAGVAAAAALSALAMWPARSFASPALALAWMAAAGGSVYAAVLLALDVAGLRAEATWFVRLARRLAGRGPRLTPPLG